MLSSYTSTNAATSVCGGGSSFGDVEDVGCDDGGGSGSTRTNLWDSETECLI